jgi:hypothetical protein
VTPTGRFVTLAAAAYSLMRFPKLLAAAGHARSDSAWDDASARFGPHFSHCRGMLAKGIAVPKVP